MQVVCDGVLQQPFYKLISLPSAQAAEMKQANCIWI